MNLANRRIENELEKFNTNPPWFCSAGPSGNGKDIHNWTGIIIGPSDSVYRRGIFYVGIEFPITYPYKPPKVHFITKIFHPSIDSSGMMSLSILNDTWVIIYRFITFCTTFGKC